MTQRGTGHLPHPTLNNERLINTSSSPHGKERIYELREQKEQQRVIDSLQEPKKGDLRDYLVEY